METKVSSTKSSGTKRSSAKSSRAKNKSQNEQLTKQESENEKDWMMEDLKGEESKENQEYINAEMENKRFNKKLGLNRKSSTEKSTVRTSRINKKKKSENSTALKRESDNKEKDSDFDESERRPLRRSNGERLMRSKSRTTSENGWIKERNGSHRRWRNRSARHRVYNRNYERGFKDGYRAAMEELRANTVQKRRKTDGEFRFNERRNQSAKKKSNDQFRNERNSQFRNERNGQFRNERMNGYNPQELQRAGRFDMNIPPVSQSVREKAVKSVRGSGRHLDERIHFEEHPTGRFFIEHFTGGSSPYNEHLENMRYRTKVDSLINKKGRKVVH